MHHFQVSPCLIIVKYGKCAANLMVSLCILLELADVMANVSTLNEEQRSCRSVDSTISSPDDQQPSTSSLGTDPQRTTTSESTSPVIESPSLGDNVETCVPPPTDPALWKF